jgi:23S rRNA (adenine2503-C2)-methyltransferase
VNDSRDQARSLTELLGRDHFKVNLIPYNPWAASAVGEAAGARPNTPPTAAGGLYEGSSRERIAAFRHELERAHVPVTVRLTRGRDIEAACGQLAAAPRQHRRAASPA